MTKKLIIRTLEEVYDLWIAALRSGKYKQTRKVLRDNEGFCCLGVLCDLSRKDGGPKWNEGGWGDYIFKDEIEGLPVIMSKFMQISREEETTLMRMNDDDEASFKEIADYIEKELKPKALSRAS